MNEIAFTVDNELPLAVQNRIVEIEKTIVELKKAENTLKATLLEEMQKRGIKKIDTPKLTITVVDETTKETFDSKSFRADHRDLYDDYVKISDVKAYVKIGVKNGD